MNSKLIVCLVIIAALSLRFYNFPAWFGFDYDQEINAWMAKSIIVDHKLTLIGPETSIGGMYVGPYFNYVISLFFAMGKMDPTWTILLNILISTATIIAFYWAGGITAAVIYGFSAFIIDYDRVLWNPTPIPLFSLLLIMFFCRFLKNSQKTDLFLSSACLGVLFHLHLQAIFPAMFIFLVLLTKRSPKNFLIAALPLFFFFAPLILFDLRHDFLNSRHLFQFFWGSSPTGAGNLRIMPALFSFFQAVIGVKNQFLALVVLGLVLFRARKNLLFVFNFAMIIFSLIIFSFYRGPLPIYYFLFLLPAIILLAADALSFVWPVVLIFLLVTSVPSVLTFKSDLTLKYKQQAVSFIAQTGGQVEIIAQPGLNTGFRYLLWQQKVSDQTSQHYKIIVPYFLAPSEELSARFGSIGVVKSN